MNKPLHPAFRLVASGALSLILVYIWKMAGRDPRWCIVIGGVAAAAFVLLVPVLLQGDSWQKMAAGILPFVPSFGLLMAAFGVLSSL